jgi:hypothetical protein
LLSLDHSPPFPAASTESEATLELKQSVTTKQLDH